MIKWDRDLVVVFWATICQKLQTDNTIHFCKLFEFGSNIIQWISSWKGLV